jgi:hypothetical protein
MAAGSQPCPWLIPEDIPRERRQPLAGSIIISVDLEGIGPSVALPPVGEGRTRPGPQKTLRPAIPDKSLDWLAFLFTSDIIKK